MDIIAKKAIEFFERQQKTASVMLEEMAAKRDAAKRKGESFASWFSWNGMVYIHWEFRLKQWNYLLSCLRKFVEEGKSGKDIIGYISGIREMFVCQALNYHPAHSTNKLSNMIEDESNEVDKAIAGSNHMDSGSLNYLLMILKDDEAKKA